MIKVQNCNEVSPSLMRTEMKHEQMCEGSRKLLWSLRLGVGVGEGESMGDGGLSLGAIGSNVCTGI